MQNDDIINIGQVEKGVYQMAKIRITITADEGLYREILLIANKEERSISQQISFLLRKGIEEKEQVNKWQALNEKMDIQA